MDLSQIESQLPLKIAVASVVSTMAESGVPSLLWDTLLLSLYGVPTAIFNFSFIVPDDQIQTAYEALRGATYYPCDLADECRVNVWAWGTPPPKKHLHSTPERYISLFTISQLFHPDHPPNMSQDSPDLMPASDTLFIIYNACRGCGPYPANLHPVRVPTPIFYTEAVLRLAARDLDEDNAHHDHWMVAQSYIASYVDGISPGLFQPQDLKPEFKRAWTSLAEVGKPGGERMVTVLRRLKGELPPWEPLQSIRMPTRRTVL